MSCYLIIDNGSFSNNYSVAVMKLTSVLVKCFPLLQPVLYVYVCVCVCTITTISVECQLIGVVYKQLLNELEVHLYKYKSFFYQSLGKYLA